MAGHLGVDVLGVVVPVWLRQSDDAPILRRPTVELTVAVIETAIKYAPPR